MQKQIHIMYLRKSRADSDSESVEETLARHEQILQDYAINKWEKRIPEEYIYREVVSGDTIAARPEIQKVLHAMESKDVDGVLVVDPQRLSRGDLVDCGTISNAFRYSNTKCYTPMMTYDLTQKHERKFFEAELMRGGEYLEYTKEILRRGRLLSVQNGNYIGSKSPYGYKKVKQGSGKKQICTLEIIPEEADAIRTIFDLYANTPMGFAAIANELDRLGYKPMGSYWSVPTLKDIIENPVYIGKIRWNHRKEEKIIENGIVRISRPKNALEDCTLYDGLHEPIIDEDLFYAAQSKKGKNVKIQKGVELRNPFAGILFCQCGRAMSFKSSEKSKKKNENSRMVCNGQKYCNTCSCNYPDFENYVIQVLEQSIEKMEVELNSNRFDNTVSFSEERKKLLEKELKELDERENELYDFLETKIYSKEVFLKRRQIVEERRQQIARAMDSLNAMQNDKKIIEQKISDFIAALDALKDHDMDASTQNYLLKKCITKIVYSKEKSTKWDRKPFHCETTLNM